MEFESFGGLGPKGDTLGYPTESGNVDCRVIGSAEKTLNEKQVIQSEG